MKTVRLDLLESKATGHGGEAVPYAGAPAGKRGKANCANRIPSTPASRFEV